MLSPLRTSYRFRDCRLTTSITPVYNIDVISKHFKAFLGRIGATSYFYTSYILYHNIYFYSNHQKLNTSSIAHCFIMHFCISFRLSSPFLFNQNKVYIPYLLYYHFIAKYHSHKSRFFSFPKKSYYIYYYLP